MSNYRQKRGLPPMKFTMEVKAVESGELYPDQAKYEEFDDIEVMVELFCDHPDVEGSFEIIGSRGHVKQIMDELGVDPSDVVRSVGGKQVKVAAIQENSEETLTQVFEDVSERATGKKPSPLQQTLLYALDSLVKS